MPNPTNSPTATAAQPAAPGTPSRAQAPAAAHAAVLPPREIHGPAGPEPTRYGDWERLGRCIDF